MRLGKLKHRPGHDQPPPGEITREARSQIEALRHHYRFKQRPEASRNLTLALNQAVKLILAGKGVAYPRPYPEIFQPERAWVHSERYWIRYALTMPPVITGVFYDAADIPGRA